jgi:hypothetical protein
VQTDASNLREDIERQVSAQGVLQSYLLRAMESLQVVLESEALLMQLSCLGLKWGECPEIDQKFLEIMQDMSSRMESVRSIRCEAMDTFEFHDLADDETRHNGMFSTMVHPPPGLREQTLPQSSAFNGPMGNNVNPKKCPLAPVVSSYAANSHLAAPYMPFGKRLAPPTTFQYSGDDSFDRTMPINIFDRSLSHLEVLGNRSRVASQLLNLNLGVEPRIDHSPINRQSAFENREVVGTAPRTLPPSHTLPSMSSWEGAEYIKHPTKTPSAEDAESIFMQGMISLFPSFFSMD